MNLQHLMERQRIARFIMALSRRVPPRTAYRLASLLAGAVLRMRPEVYWIVRANMSQALGAGAGPQDVERTVRRVFYHAIRNYYNTYHTLELSREEIVESVDFPPAAQDLARSTLAMGRGAILVTPHLGNFDMLAQALGGYTSPIQVMTLPNPPAGFQVLNEVRRRSGVDITPLSPAALRQSLRVLRAGGVVAIAADRSVSDLDEKFPFFGRLACLPSGHVRLSLKTGAPLIIGCCIYVSETQRYRLYLEPPVEMVRAPDPDEEVRANVRRVLERLEEIIGRWLEQWMIFVPIWPELVEVGR